MPFLHGFFDAYEPLSQKSNQLKELSLGRQTLNAVQGRLYLEEITAERHYECLHEILSLAIIYRPLRHHFGKVLDGFGFDLNSFNQFH